MSKQLGMVIDATLCMDCKGCMASCKQANKVPAGQWRNWVKDGGLEQASVAGGRLIFQPGGCMHCDKPTCVTACPTGATYKDKSDGTVKIDRALCIGCGQCIPSCPYGARYRHPTLRVADKCDFCVERRAQGLEPACVTTCPTKARVFGDLKDPKSAAGRLWAAAKAKKELVQVVNDKTPTDPNLYYVGDPGSKHWPVAAVMPSAFDFFKNLAKPAINVVVGLTGLGVLAMLAKQVLMPGDAPEEHQGQGGDHE